MASLSVGEETPEQVIARMQRELDHVSEQSRVSHRMAIYWQQQATKTEKLRARMERSLNTWREKLLQKPKGKGPTEAELNLWAAEGDKPDTSDPKVW